MSAGQIVTFYSYKGGTGRTMSLANTAWLLAGNGLRVLAIDWDLESPGLHRYFHPFLLDKKLVSSPGVIDMMWDYASAAMEPGHTESTDWVHEHAAVLDYAVSLDWQFPEGGGIDLLPAGRQDRSYARRVSTFDWASFWDRLGGGDFINAIAADARQHYDYILIDSRTGLSDSAGICTIQLPDTIVNCFTLSAQSIDGAASVARSVVAQRDRRPVRVLPVPMRIENAEALKLEAGRDYARQEFRPFLGEMGEAADRYWGEVEVPYKPFFAYEEILAPFAERPLVENSLLAAYERLTGWITRGHVQSLPPMDETLRRNWLVEFERRRPPATADVVVSYVAVDRMWAEWVVSELTAAGLRATLSDVDFATSADVDVQEQIDRTLAGVRFALVLLSRDYVASRNAATVWQQVARLDAGSRVPLVPVRLDGTRIDAPYTDRPPVDLAGATAERARELLLAAVGAVPNTTNGPRVGPRFPGLLPPVWNVQQRNADFTGRGVVLEQLRDRLSASITAVVPQALFGLGGVGKTQLGLEYAHRFAANYDAVWWISAEQPHMVRSSLAELGRALHLESGDNLDEAVRIVLDALRQGRPYQRWLIIFDNVDRPEDIRDFIPQGAGHVLLTSRNQAWNQEAHALQLGVFTLEESVALLRRRVPQISLADAEQVAERLGHLPLAIEQAGAWLTATAMSVSQYLGLLDTQLIRVLDENPPLGYEKTTAATWLLSLERLRQTKPAAAKLLEICAFFAPEPISTKLIYSSRFTQVLLPFDPALRDPILQGQLLREIGRYALATMDSGRRGIQIHRLVQAVIRNSLDEAAQAEDRADVQSILSSFERGSPENPENWPTYALIWPHLRASGALESADPAVRQLVSDMARYLEQRSDYSSSRELAGNALQIWRDRFGEDTHTHLLAFHLGNALRWQARYTESYDLDRYVLDRLTETAGPDHPYTVIVAGSVGADLRALGRYQEALEISRNTRDRALEVFGEADDRTLKAATNLAVSLRLVGDFAGAAEIDERVVGDRRRYFGDDYPMTLGATDNLAHDLRALGRFAESRELLERIFGRYQEVLGSGASLTLRTAKSLAATLRKLGEFNAAHALTNDTLRRYRETVGTEHPEALSCLMNRACEESALGDHVTARITAEQAVNGFKVVYSQEHPFVLAGLNNLAIFTRLAGAPTDARRLNADVLTAFRATLGARHPYTLSSQANLASDMFESGEYDAALRQDEQTWVALREVLTEDNPDTLAVAANLAVSRRQVGDRGGADELRFDTIRRAKRILGDAHPNVTAMINGRRLNCDISPPPI
ncbi:FxSxx-COOH system tetratricopeptide repeat protein [Actinoplanes sp. NPDC020271]|uniref:FxSxx-COOH system tetratricopeptide repeat protein n=1 Tax=Actinoplanes sp. NPDC020271 TaxID=3363896 RepID=UPI0037A62C0B